MGVQLLSRIYLVAVAESSAVLSFSAVTCVLMVGVLVSRGSLLVRKVALIGAFEPAYLAGRVVTWDGAGKRVIDQRVGSMARLLLAVRAHAQFITGVSAFGLEVALGVGCISH